MLLQSYWIIELVCILGIDKTPDASNAGGCGSVGLLIEALASFKSENIKRNRNEIQPLHRMGWQFWCHRSFHKCWKHPHWCKIFQQHHVLSEWPKTSSDRRRGGSWPPSFASFLASCVAMPRRTFHTFHDVFMFFGVFWGLRFRKSKLWVRTTSRDTMIRPCWTMTHAMSLQERVWAAEQQLQPGDHILVQWLG